MIQTVVKRDGRIVGFNEQKIGAAIRKAMLTTETGEDSELIVKITDRVSIRGKSQMTVEEIQDTKGYEEEGKQTVVTLDQQGGSHGT